MKTGSGVHVSMGPDDHILLCDPRLSRVRSGVWGTEAVIGRHCHIKSIVYRRLGTHIPDRHSDWGGH